MEEKNEERPPSSPSISSVTTDSETETWEVIENKEKNVDDEHKQENLKITIDKAESIRSLDEQLSSDDVTKGKDACQNVNNNFIKTEKSSLLNRVDDVVNDNRNIYEDYSDGISVISESEIECTDGHADDQPPHDTLEDPKKDLILKPSSSVCLVSNESIPILVCLKNFLANNQFATIAIISIVVAILGGIFCQLSMMLNGSHVPPSSGEDVNLLLCQNKISELERENGNLRIELSILQREIEELQLRNTVQQETITQEPLEKRDNRMKGSFKHKKVKTRYDSFKRPPVAAGGEEETIVHVDKPLINDEEEEQEQTWNDYLEPLQNLWDDPVVDPVHDEPLNFDNFEPIKMSETETETNPTLNSNENLPEEELKGEETEVDLVDDVRETVNVHDQEIHNNYEKFDKKSKNHDKEKQFEKPKKYKYDKDEQDKNTREKSKDFKKYDEEKVYEKKPKKYEENIDSSEDENKREKRSRKEGSGKAEEIDSSEGKKKHKKRYNNKDYDNNKENRYKDEKSKNYERKHKDRSKDSNEESDFKENKNRRRQDGSDENKQNGYKKDRKEYQKRGEKGSKPGSGSSKENDSGENDRNWHEDRMKNREKHRNAEKDDNWYIERKLNREKHREGRDKDSNWYMERTLERELLRSRERDSKEKSK